MDKQQLQDLVKWINKQIDYANKVINQSHDDSNFGREAKYEGIREALIECLHKLNYSI